MERNQDRKAATPNKPKPASQGRSSQTTTETSPASQGPSLSPSRKPASTPPNIAGSMVAPVPPQDDGSREARIAREAYYRAERRGFQPGNELDDWLEAEKELEGARSTKQ